VWCPSVRPSVTFAYSVETNKRVVKFFLIIVSHTILGFHTKRHDNILQVGYVRKITISVSRFVVCCQRCDRLGVVDMVPPDRGKLMRFIAGGSKRENLLMAGDGRRSVYDKKP